MQTSLRLMLAGVAALTLLMLANVAEARLPRQVSEIFTVEPGPFIQTLAEYSGPRVRHIKVTVWVDFSSTTGQTCQILATMPSGGARAVGETFVNANGTQQHATIAFDAAEWFVNCFNNDAVNTEPLTIQYHATTR